jgi:hypothetical protein
MQRSIRYINDTFKAWTADHKMLKTYVASPITEFKAESLVYPLLWTQWGEATFASANDGGATITIGANVYVLDRLQRSKGNWIDVLSDTLRIIEDFYNYFNDGFFDTNPYTSTNEQFRFLIANDAVAVPVYASYDDLVGGWQIPVSIIVGNDRNEYQIPITDGGVQGS